MKKIYLILVLCSAFQQIGFSKESSRKLVKNYHSETDCFEYLESRGLDFREIYKIECNISKVAKKLLAGENAVPPVIYHWGKKSYMLENASEGNITEFAWKKFIMGEETRYSLASSRRGLYGTSTILFNQFSGLAHNWINEIHIAKNCRDPERTISFLNLYENPNFIKWSKKTKYPVDLSNFKSNCFSQPDINGISEPFMGYQGEFYNGDESCQEILETFLKEEDIKIIQDHVINMAWYIRDRKCITDIRGEPRDIIDMLTTRNVLWRKPCSTEYPHSSDQLLNMLEVSLEEIRKDGPLNPEIINLLRDQAERSDILDVKDKILQLLEK